MEPSLIDRDVARGRRRVGVNKLEIQIVLINKLTLQQEDRSQRRCHCCCWLAQPCCRRRRSHSHLTWRWRHRQLTSTSAMLDELASITRQQSRSRQRQEILSSSARRICPWIKEEEWAVGPDPVLLLVWSTSNRPTPRHSHASAQRCPQPVQKAPSPSPKTSPCSGSAHYRHWWCW